MGNIHKIVIKIKMMENIHIIVIKIKMMVNIILNMEIILMSFIQVI
jgi:hypothetical protein